MSAQIELKDLSSFFELFVAYTFAYSSLSSIKDGVNKASVKDLDDKVVEYERLYKKESENASDISIISYSELDPVIQKRIQDLNIKVSHIQRLKRITTIFYSGDFLRPLFYLTGAIYLFYILLSVFQDFVGDLSVMIIVNAITIYSWLYYIYYYYKYIKPYTTLNFEKIDWNFPTKKTLKRICCFIVFCVVAATIISMYIHSHYPEVHRYNEGRVLKFVYITKRDLYNSLSVIGILSLAIIPFAAFYLRERLIIVSIDKGVKDTAIEFNDIIDDIKALSKAKANIFKITNSVPEQVMKESKPRKQPKNPKLK